MVPQSGCCQVLSGCQYRNGTYDSEGWTAPLCLRLGQYQGSYINVGDVIKMDIWNFLLIRHVIVQAIKRITFK